MSEDHSHLCFIIECTDNLSLIISSNGSLSPCCFPYRCGGGRTAVFIAVDFCLHQLQAEDRVDVYSIVLHLRRFRKNMVRTLVSNILAINCCVSAYDVASLRLFDQ